MTDPRICWNHLQQSVGRDYIWWICRFHDSCNPFPSSTWNTTQKPWWFSRGRIHIFGTVWGVWYSGDGYSILRCESQIGSEVDNLYITFTYNPYTSEVFHMVIAHFLTGFYNVLHILIILHFLIYTMMSMMSLKFSCHFFLSSLFLAPPSAGG